MAQDAENDVGQLMRQLEEAVAPVRQESDLKERKKKQREAQTVWRKTKYAINAMRKEVNRIEDPTQKSVYTKKHQEHSERLDAYDKEMRMLIRPPRKGGAATGERAAMDNIIGETDPNSANQVMRAANRAQDDNLRILANIERDVGVTDELGNEIAIRLQTDTEKINEINRELNTLQANLDRAKGEVQWFARQMATDKCFLVLIVIMILGLCLLTFWKIYRSRRDGDEPAPAPAPAPAAPPPETSSMAARALHKVVQFAMS